MDPLVIYVLAVEKTRRESRSALPQAEVQPPSAAWLRFSAALRNVVHPRRDHSSVFD